MGVFSNFIKKRSSIGDVLQSLDNFKVDQPSFEAVKMHSVAFFGDNWKFNLEMYISSLSKNDRARYYEIFKTVVEYETALSYWNRALKITNYTVGVSRDDLIESGLYKKYLSKFGVEGTRLYQKLEKFLSVNEKIENDANQQAIKDTDVSFPDNENLQDKIKKQVEKVESSVDSIAKKILKSSDKKGVNFTASLTEVITEPVEEKKIEKQDVKVERNKLTQQKDKNWDVNNFYQIHKFMPTLRSIMSAISLYKKSSAIEEYNGYVFLNDTLDYLINEGEKILSKITDEKEKNNLLAIIENYKQEKLNEVEYVVKTETGNTEDKPYKHPYEN